MSPIVAITNRMKKKNLMRSLRSGEDDGRDPPRGNGSDRVTKSISRVLSRIIIPPLDGNSLLNQVN